MIKYIFSIALSTLLLLSCPFDEANVEVTVLAHTSINGASKLGNFIKAKEALQKNKKLYEYFEKANNVKLYTPLAQAIESKNTSKIKALLDKSLVLEIKELLGKAEKSFTKYQKVRLLLIKTKRHLKALTREKIAMKYMKKIFKSIGNPGLMGVGKKKPNKNMFRINVKKLMKVIQ
ncbi:MAG: hypothetical protein QM493_00925 [Sulfurovum sp.]